MKLHSSVGRRDSCAGPHHREGQGLVHGSTPRPNTSQTISLGFDTVFPCCPVLIRQPSGSLSFGPHVQKGRPESSPFRITMFLCRINRNV